MIEGLREDLISELLLSSPISDTYQSNGIQSNRDASVLNVIAIHKSFRQVGMLLHGEDEDR